MKIHEYQGKQILGSYNIPIQDGVVIDSKDAIESAIDEVAEKFSCNEFIVKAQIHAGGRGKGGGVKYCPDKSSAMEAANNILHMNLVTPQTGEAGQKVRKIYITKAFDIAHEYYAAITLDRSKHQDVIMVSFCRDHNSIKMLLWSLQKVEWILKKLRKKHRIKL